jgi:hypothetical protein
MKRVDTRTGILGVFVLAAAMTSLAIFSATGQGGGALDSDLGEFELASYDDFPMLVADAGGIALPDMLFTTPMGSDEGALVLMSLHERDYRVESYLAAAAPLVQGARGQAFLDGLGIPVPIPLGGDSDDDPDAQARTVLAQNETGPEGGEGSTQQGAAAEQSGTEPTAAGTRSTAPMPEPASTILFGVGLLVVGGAVRRARTS